MKMLGGRFSTLSAAWGIAAKYALFASLWILLSDSAVEWLFADPADIVRISLYKGWAFVAVTTLLLFGLVRRLLAQVIDTIDRDLTQQHQLEQTLRKVQDHALQEQNEARLAALQLMEDAQQARRRAEETTASLRKLSQAVEQSPESIVITDTAARIEYVNDAFVRTSGFSREEVMGQNPNMLNASRLTPGETFADMWAALNRGEVWKGEITNTRKDGSTYTELATIAPIKGDDGTVTHYVAVKENTTARKQSERLIHHLSHFDALTGLTNRALLLDRIEHAALASKRSHRYGMLLLLNVDEFKLLNDSHGYEAGDRLLQMVAQRLTACVREEDTVARMGADEFAVLVENLDHKETHAIRQAELIAQKIHAEFAHPFELSPGTDAYHGTPSMGVTVFKGTQATVTELLKQGDVALHKAKADGRNTTRFYSPLMQAVADQRARLEQGLRQALAHRGLRLHYQPQVDGSGQLLGAEALVRWPGSDGQFISPATFIPLAEENGLIVPLGLWVLDTGCAQLKAWQQQPGTRQLVMSINVSARQFHQPDFVTQVQAVIERSGIDPSGLKLELTESVILGDVDDTIARMRQIKALGVRFSLDDFGTGYSSLSYVKRLPFDQLKIDQSFVRDMVGDPGSAAIVRAILAMSQSLGLEVVAEGVETPEQRDLLHASGCQVYQGYLYGKPMPIEQWSNTFRSAANHGEDARSASAQVST